jgi:hypothetical protein
MKVKLKLPAYYYGMIVEMGNQLTLDNIEYNNLILAQSKLAAFSEMRQLFLDVTVKHGNAHKKVSKQIPASYCLLFFGSFYGLRMDGFLNVVIKEICAQIETQLFKSGKYKLTV